LQLATADKSLHSFASSIKWRDLTESVSTTIPPFCFVDGKCVACTFGAKFIEVSVGINHNCDELLAGTLTQIRLKKDQVQLQVCSKSQTKLKKKRTPIGLALALYSSSLLVS